MAQLKFEKYDHVTWRVTSGFCTLEWHGTVTKVRGDECYVLFQGGGHWRRQDELVPFEEDGLMQTWGSTSHWGLINLGFVPFNKLPAPWLGSGIVYFADPDFSVYDGSY